MRLIRYASLLLIIGCSFITTHAQNNKEQFVKKVFEVLQTRDRESFLKLFPDLATYKKIVIEIGKKAHNDDDEAEYAKEVEGWTQKDYNEKIAPLKEEFDEIIKKGEKKGVQWVSAKMESWSEVSPPGDEIMAKAGFKMLGGKIAFTSGGKEFIIEFEQTLWYQPDNRWYGIQFEKLYEKGKEDEEYGKELELMMGDNSADTMAVAVDTVAVPVPVQPKKTVPKKTVPNKTTKPATAKPPVRKDN